MKKYKKLLEVDNNRLLNHVLKMMKEKIIEKNLPLMENIRREEGFEPETFYFDDQNIIEVNLTWYDNDRRICLNITFGEGYIWHISQPLFVIKFNHDTEEEIMAEFLEIRVEIDDELKYLDEIMAVYERLFVNKRIYHNEHSFSYEYERLGYVSGLIYITKINVKNTLFWKHPRRWIRFAWRLFICSQLRKF